MCVKLGKENQIQEMRAYILEHAESKARNRAIRQALALKGKYTEDELRRPFVVPALVETGRCDDSELRKLYFEKKLEGKGLATKALFQGGDPMLRPGDADVIEVKATPAKPRPVGTEYIDEETGEVKGDPDSSDDPFSG